MAKDKLKTNNTKKPAQTVAPPQTSAPARPGQMIPEWVGIGLLLLLAAVLRWAFLDIPLERDESVYYYAGKIALDGGRPYFDFYEMKPPGLFYSYALLVALFGYSGVGAHLALLFVSLSNTLFTYLIARKFGDTRMALIAAMAFVFFSIHPGASGVYLEGEHVALLWGLPGTWLALQYPERTNRYLLLGSGFLLSLAVLVKQTAGVFGLSIVIYWLSRWWTGRREQSLKPLIWWVAGGLLPLLGAFLVIWASGSLQYARFWLYEYPQHYATSTNEDNAGLYFRTSWTLVSTGYLGYYIVAGLGLPVLWWSRLSVSAKTFLTAWTLLSAFTIVPGLRFYGHYYLMAFPAASIAGALLFSTIGTRISKKETIPLALTILGLLWGAHHFLIRSNLYIRPPLQFISRVYSPGNPFVEHQMLSDELKKVIQPNDTVAVFGSDLQYFIYLGKTSPIRHVYMPFFAKNQFAEIRGWQEEIIQKLKETRPKYVIFNAYPYAWMMRFDQEGSFAQQIVACLQQPDYDPYIFIEADSKSKPAVVKYKVQQGMVKNKVNFIQVFKRRD
jgi:hypothetical protein